MSIAVAAKPTGLARLKAAKPSVEVTVKHGEPDEDDKEKPEWDDWQLKDHADTLARAEEIKANPKLMEALKPHIEKKAKAYKSLNQLRKRAAMLPKGE